MRKKKAYGTRPTVGKLSKKRYLKFGGDKVFLKGSLS